MTRAAQMASNGPWPRMQKAIGMRLVYVNMVSIWLDYSSAWKRHRRHRIYFQSIIYKGDTCVELSPESLVGLLAFVLDLIISVTLRKRLPRLAYTISSFSPALASISPLGSTMVEWPQAL